MRLGREATAARQQASRLAGLAGRCPAPHTAPVGRGLLGRHAAWPGFYRRGTTGATARRSGAAPCLLTDSDRHSATGLMARNKGQRDFEIPLAFCVAKIPKPHQNIPTRKGGRLPTVHCGEKKSSPFIHAAKSPSCTEASQPARGKPAHSRLRRSRAAIGSGGKKARPF